MTVRENVHQLIDKLPEDRLDDLLGYMADLEDEADSPSPESKAGVGDEPRNGNTLTVREYQRTHRH